MRLSADRRLGPYVVMAVAGVVAALVTGAAALVALAAPAAVLVVAGLADRRALEVRVVGIEAPARVLEGDHWMLRIQLEWLGEATLDILHTGIKGSEIQGPPGWRVSADGGATAQLEAVARGWGRHDLGSIEVRARRSNGMLRWDGNFALGDAIRVLPTGSRLDDLLHPRRPRVAAGSHVAPIRGPGTDFADLRPYVPGDRLRDVSWAASARGDQPWVVVHHPERTGTVVLLLDSFVEVGAPRGSLDRAARVVWSIARHHLVNGDRVGLVSVGSSLAWLPPVSGRRARWQVLDALLTIGSDIAGSRPSRSRAGGENRHVLLPADAVVVGVSPLQSDGFVASVLHHVRLGRPVMVIGIATTDLLDPPGDETERAARRLWELDIELRRSNLSRAGVPSAMVVDDGAKAVRLLSRRQPRNRIRRVHVPHARLDKARRAMARELDEVAGGRR